MLSKNRTVKIDKVTDSSCKETFYKWLNVLYTYRLYLKLNFVAFRRRMSNIFHQTSDSS